MNWILSAAMWINMERVLSTKSHNFMRAIWSVNLKEMNKSIIIIFTNIFWGCTLFFCFISVANQSKRDIVITDSLEHRLAGRNERNTGTHRRLAGSIFLYRCSAMGFSHFYSDFQTKLKRTIW